MHYAKFKSFFVMAALMFLTFDGSVFASVFYKFDVVAQPNDFPSGIKDTVSINDKGMVAFIGMKSSDTEGVLIGDGLNPFTLLSGYISGRRYASGVQINNSNQVVVRRSAGINDSSIRVYDGNFPGDFTIIVRGDGTGGGGTAISRAAFDSVFSHPSLSNKGTITPYVVFSALETGSSDTVLSTPIDYGDADKPGGGKRTNFNTTGNLGIPLRPMIADDGRIVVRAGGGVTGTDQDPIVVYSNDFQQKTTIASIGTLISGSNTIKLGRSPGISDDGTVVAFAGETGNGQGVFICIDEGKGFGTATVIAVAGADRKRVAELGYDDKAQPLFLDSFDLNSRVGVVRETLGDPGFRDDVIVVSFVATPNNASISNLSTGKPLTFTKNKGIWTVRIDFDRPRTGSAVPRFNIHVNSPIPVVQVGDQIQTTLISFLVNDLAVYDPLALAAEGDSGIRTQRRGDHRIAFRATNGTSPIVVRGEHLDSDQDGLLDHWESSGGGIDVDQDGTVDLNLYALDARPDKRDLFLEIDWLADRTSGFVLPHSNEPLPGVTSAVASKFLAAPPLSGTLTGFRSDGTPPDAISGSITAHIDAGAGKDCMGNDFSVGTSTSYQGGDKITLGGSHIDVVYFGTSTTLAGYGVLKARSFHNIKNNFFGTTDKRAREFAFHYAVLADFRDLLPSTTSPYQGTVGAATSMTLTDFGAPFAIDELSGDAVMIISSGNSSEGQIRTIGSNTTSIMTLRGDPWSTIPDVNAKYVLLSGSSGLAEEGLKEGIISADYWTRPGNDFIMSLGSFGIEPMNCSGKIVNYLGAQLNQMGAILHELGHTIGLRHGGYDDVNYRNDYWSLMNYKYAYGGCTDSTAITICNNGSNCFLTSLCMLAFLDYSRTGDSTFVDWENLRMDVFNTGYNIGNSFNLGAFGSSEQQDEMNIAEFEEIYGPIDLVAPVVVINSPKPGASILTALDMTVNVTATDNVGIADVTISFDIDGDGNVSGHGESISATNTIGDTYEATFWSIYGPDGQRTIEVVAKDDMMSLGIADGTVTVTASLGGTVTPITTPMPSPTPASSPTPVVIATPTPEITLTPTPAPSPSPTYETSPEPLPTPSPVIIPTTPPTPKATPKPSPTEPPTAVELVFFKAKANDNGSVTLRWRTATEVNNAGFNLYRAKRKNGSYTKINGANIPVEGNSTAGASYEYKDTPGLGIFYYKLEDVDTKGASAMHGPVKIRLRSAEGEAKRRRR